MALIQKAFSDIIAFSRSSNATRVGPTGLVEYAPHNLLVRSQEFDNAAWGKTNTTITANAIAAPDGTVTADLMLETTTNGGHSAGPGAALSSATYTVSFYAKYYSRQWVRVDVTGVGAAICFFDIQNGVLGNVASGTTSSITNVGSGWYRCSVTFTGAAWPFIGLASANGTVSYAGVVTEGAYFWGAQLAVGPYALDYTPTTSAAVYGPRFDYDGSAVTSVDPVSRNLLTYSEQFDNGAWFKGLATITSNALSAPDGTVTADLATAGAGTGVSEISGQISSGTFANNSVVTFSVYFKAGTKDSVTLSYNVASGNYAVAVFDLSGVSVSQTAQLGTFVLNGSSITSVGSGWFRCSISFTSSNFSATTNVPFVGIAPAKTGNTFNSNGRISATYAGTETVYLWGAQLEVGSTATGYMVSGATNGFRAVPVVSGSATARGLLVEEQRTNLVTYSEQFDSSDWVKSNSSVTANSTTSPNGTNTADKLVEDTSTNGHLVYQSFTSTAQAYTWSCYVKAAERTQCFIRAQDASLLYAYFDLSAGTVISAESGLTASIQNVGNGWYRCIVTRTVSAGTSFFVIGTAVGGSASYTGNGTSGIYLWGAQLEAGSFATSLIPTIASTVTRSADVASVNTLSPWVNQTEGTLYVEVGPKSNWAANQRMACLALADTSARTADIYNNGTYISMFGSGGAGITNAEPGVGIVKAAGAFKLNDYALSANGTAATTDTSATVPTADVLGIGTFIGSSTSYLNGHVRRIAFYPRRLSNAELAALSA